MPHGEEAARDATEQQPEQEALFAEPDRCRTLLLGYRGPTACPAAGITYRQLDYWARTGLVVPSVRSAAGSGSQRLYSFKDILVLKVVKRLLDTGVSLQNIRIAVEHLRARGVDDLARITLLSDGTTCTSAPPPRRSSTCCTAARACSASRSSGALRELHGSLAELPAERAEPVEDRRSAPTEPTSWRSAGSAGPPPPDPGTGRAAGSEVEHGPDVAEAARDEQLARRLGQPGPAVRRRVPAAPQPARRRPPGHGRGLARLRRRPLPSRPAGPAGRGSAGWK